MEIPIREIMDEADHDFPMDRVLSAFLISGVTHMRVFVMWPGRKDDPKSPRKSTIANYLMGWSASAGEDPPHIDVYPFKDPNTGNPCFSPGEGSCKYDISHFNENWKARLERITKSWQSIYEIDPCLVLADNSLFSSSTCSSSMEAEDNHSGTGIAGNADKVKAELKRIATHAYLNAGIQCIESFNEPNDSIQLLSSQDQVPVVQSLNGWANDPSENGLADFIVLSDDTWTSSDCYTMGFATHADFFMPHTMHFTPLVGSITETIPDACQLRSCFNQVRNQIAQLSPAPTLALSDDGSRDCTREANYFKYLTWTHLKEGEWIEYHFHKLADPNPPTLSCWAKEVTDMNYFKELITTYLPQWHWPGVRTDTVQMLACKDFTNFNTCTPIPQDSVVPVKTGTDTVFFAWTSPDIDCGPLWKCMPAVNECYQPW